MLNLPSYYFYSTNSHFDYEFLSIGLNGSIKKIARFRQRGDNVYNFGFGDLNETTGEISDTTASNNGDRDVVLATVAKIIYEFTGLFPDAIIFIVGSDGPRTRLYQQGIIKFWEQIEPVFEISGYKNGKWLPFKKGINYDAFMGIRKSDLFF
jgi:hypothetical protein